ncbi:uncharacterized protein LOC131213480, partial [Anopheles bellator]|uniref:uncharacterized protein LOC131213480 n=1 Tax=Anopheles bellator TaxID=139047 RepID=UPI002649DDFC
MSKKSLAQRVKDESSFLEAAAATPAVPPPLIGPLGLSGASAPGPLLVAPPPTFSSPSANITVAAPLRGSAPSSFSVAAQKNGSSTTIKPQTSSAEPEQLYQQTQNLDHAGQLNLLQMMHPSLEITATPTMPRTPGSSRKSSKTKSDYGGERKQRKPPISSSDLSVAYGDGTEYSVPGD